MNIPVPSYTQITGQHGLIILLFFMFLCLALYVYREITATKKSLSECHKHRETDMQERLNQAKEMGDLKHKVGYLEGKYENLAGRNSVDVHVKKDL